MLIYRSALLKRTDCTLGLITVSLFIQFIIKPAVLSPSEVYSEREVCIVAGEACFWSHIWNSQNNFFL